MGASVKYIHGQYQLLGLIIQTINKPNPKKIDSIKYYELR